MPYFESQNWKKSKQRDESNLSQFNVPFVEEKKQTVFLKLDNVQVRAMMIGIQCMWN